MAQTNIFVGNIGSGILMLNSYPILPGTYIPIQDKMSLTSIVSSHLLQDMLFLGLAAVKVGGTEWSDATEVFDLPGLFSLLTGDEQQLATGGSTSLMYP
jgi:hypothetical protein